MTVGISKTPASVLALMAGLACAGPAFARCEDYVPGPKPQNTAAQDIGREFDDILESGWIEFALYEDFAPWSYEEGGKAQGIDVEIGRIIAEDLGVTPKFRLVQADENLESDLRNYIWKGAVIGGRVSDVMLHVPYDSKLTCRVEQVVFTGQYAGEALAIGYDRAEYPDGGPTPAYFRYDTVAVENDSLPDFYLASIGHGSVAEAIHRYPNAPAAVAAMIEGETMASMAPLAVIEAEIETDQVADRFAVHRPPLPGLARTEWTVGVAVGMQHRDLGYAVDYAIEKALNDGRIEAIFAAHGLSFLPPER
ncbi:substrate-binding periplasmic protein [Celeribacter neptunius]|uniref:Amino acid ABC transporter substrate-binding protein, PAAT family (TC 3.A.1.3.-) n=1 Tax=Celeribacter neptunius TaxID=588602 RepID=A0A1I3UGH3_9RHOB|nr:transporter substrate-binding domain-containing protein [Celeribacter neptunius]SFJ81803.1 amino acid ABC transporter substrate-binding protein, PAAT family (TC 3.A.1.3.-) [Celeribacter neptunius]